MKSIVPKSTLTFGMGEVQPRIVGFHADSVAELHIAFEESVDDYIETCKKVGKLPQKPYSGKVMLRIPPELHARAAMLAEARGKSLNSWVTDLLTSAA